MSNGLRFDIYERVHLPENVAAIDELEEIELVPRIQVIDQGENAVLQGQLVLNGIYRAQGAGDEQVALEHWIPVEITLPMNRVTKLDEITVDIDTFDVVLLSSRALNLTGILSLRGITLEQEEESSSWNMESFTASHSLGEDGYYREDEVSYEAAQQQYDAEQQFEAQQQHEAVQQYELAQQQYEALQQHEQAERFSIERQNEVAQHYEAAEQYETVQHYEVAEQYETVQHHEATEHYEAVQHYEAAEQYEAEQRFAYEQQYRANAEAEAALQAEHEQQYSEFHTQTSPFNYSTQAAETGQYAEQYTEQYGEQEETQYRPEDISQQNWQQASADQLASYVQFIEQKYAAIPEPIASNDEQVYETRAEEQQEDRPVQAEEEHAIEVQAVEEQLEEANTTEQQASAEQSDSSSREEASTETDVTSSAEVEPAQNNQQENEEQWSEWESAVAEESSRVEEAEELFENEQVEDVQSEDDAEAAPAVTEPPVERAVHIALNGNKEENETQGIRTILNSSLREQAAQQAATIQKQEADRKEAEAAKQQAVENEVEWQQLFIGKRPEQNEFKRIRMIIVQKDDTLEQIATRYNISARDLLIRNNLHESAITAGQLLYIPS